MQIIFTGFDQKMEKTLTEKAKAYGQNASVIFDPAPDTEKVVLCRTGDIEGYSPKEHSAEVNGLVESYQKYDTAYAAAKFAQDANLRFEKNVIVRIAHRNEVAEMDYFKALRFLTRNDCLKKNKECLIDIAWDQPEVFRPAPVVKMSKLDRVA